MKTPLIIFALLLAGSMAMAQTAKVYFLRSTGYKGSAVSFKVAIDDDVVCKLNNNRYSVHDVKVGEHVFTVQLNMKENAKTMRPLTLDIVEGKTYYVELIYITKFTKVEYYCNIIPEADAQALMKKMEQDKDCGLD